MLHPVILQQSTHANWVDMVKHFILCAYFVILIEKQFLSWGYFEFLDCINPVRPYLCRVDLLLIDLMCIFRQTGKRQVKASKILYTKWTQESSPAQWQADSPKCCTPTWHADSASHRRAKSWGHAASIRIRLDLIPPVAPSIELHLFFIFQAVYGSSLRLLYLVLFMIPR